ncbi:hypothetical protein W97_06438 [Coniosporium apollinis CBS 100218]|uniref:Ribosome biogenesis protein SLX9 n=1 Tax=Coniosporium apollinis (strain CBS 100218) TaxID=1168221 RepID=R7YZ13_CONA1|nr:uncharacterized protein W97_06438 [Coniosporium apollinis CBS 100218]EON67185.1 hypothetical protein W97_06438 [Coniosporium apollinis CBS 100218]
MAPIKPARPSQRSRTTRPSTSLKPRPTFATPDTTFTSSKKDKRTIKHSVFLHKIEKTHSKAPKRRRPNKKLVADLQSLADALPDTIDNEDGGAEETVVGQARIRHKSLKSRPGAMKRKEKLERAERERFGRNMAQMAVGQQRQEGAGEAAVPGTGNRWAALRGFIEGTMEKNAAFQKT